MNEIRLEIYANPKLHHPPRKGATKRAMSIPMFGILTGFNRAPIKARGEVADTRGLVLRPMWECGHYDWRTFTALLSRGYLEYFTRCACEEPCVCSGNGYHITPDGQAALGRTVAPREDGR